jgi:hypothetical protein
VDGVRAIWHTDSMFDSVVREAHRQRWANVAAAAAASPILHRSFCTPTISQSRPCTSRAALGSPAELPPLPAGRRRAQ